ncbi:MAG TPA: GTPase domain-containing protein, partial [Gemmataceae bacterium]|nr:GTPase domain-containing protein [Gemmataceae bacterium]
MIPHAPPFRPFAGVVSLPQIVGMILMFDRVKRLFSASARDARLQEHLEHLRQQLPVPVFWLFGKTQSGKTSIIKYLTGADSAEIGKGFQPCTRFSRQYQFPLREAPLLTFLDTRGLDEPGYDPAEDLSQFNDQAHVLIVTVKALDHAQENVLTHLRTIRNARSTRPVLLVLTCLHEAYPQQQHPLPYPFGTDGESMAPPPALPADLLRSLAEQRRRFDGLVD